MKKFNFVGMVATFVALAAPILPVEAVIFVIAKPDAQIFSGTTWQTVSSTTINVNLSTSRLVLARFTSQSSCYGSGTNNYCSVRVVAKRGINVIEFDPVVGTDYAFDSTNNGTETAASWEGHALQRSKLLSSGQYQIYVQARTTNSGTTLRLDNAHFSVEYQ